ncbi:MAG: 16S rRNA (adenine(1518)-N(6)/adenine(1519)-N(6))-dimethyltransferase RsmA [Tissierellia bacterium]|nr:16S rRNA (adenine(1518)-N(6)/adenine(1519)-N(6))-dimethyltransferase RsmA [Tissierellia bacterium]
MCDKLYMPNNLNRVLKKFDFSFSKSLGQNFLIDGNVVEAIIRGAEIKDSDIVIEIGPGIGTLTQQIAKYAKKVIAIEIDKRLIPILEYTLSDFDVDIINEDALKVDFNEIVDSYRDSDIKIVANLPYNVGTSIVTNILEDRVRLESMTVMLQKEVAQRMMAKPGTKAYGSLSVLVDYMADAKEIIKVSKNVFIPKPKIDSMVIRLDPKNENKKDFEKAMFKLTRAGFNQRRKTILNSLSGDGLEKEDLKKILDKLGIAHNLRAENLSTDDYISIAKEIIKSPEIEIYC